MLKLGTHYQGLIRVAFSLFIILTAFFGYEIGNRPFADPDEGRYTEISREMVINNDFVTPKLNGLKYFEKPPLFSWLQSAVIKTFGITETSMRILPMIFAIFGCLCVFLVGASHESIKTGLIAAAILASNILYYAHSRLIILDMVLSVLMSGALWCFYAAIVRECTNHRLQKTLIISMYAMSALACLTKGLIGAVLPGLVAFLWITITKNWNKLKEILDISGILVFLVIFLPWHILVCHRNDDFFNFYFIVEHILRYTTSIHNRYQPPYFFLQILIVGFLPWTGFAIVAVKDAIKSSFYQHSDNKTFSENIFLLSWILGILGFFSCSSSKLIPYILPILPPIAFLTAKMTSVEKTNSSIKLGAAITIFLYILAVIGFLLVKHKIALILENPDVITLVSFFTLLAVISAVLFACCFWNKIIFSNILPLLIFLAMNMLWVINKATPYYQDVKRPSTKYMAEAIALNRTNDDLVFCYKRYYQDFPVYLNSTVGVVDFVGELKFGKDSDKNNQSLLTEDQFWTLWNTSKKRIFLLLSRSHYRTVFAQKNRDHKILEFDKNFVVIMNKPQEKQQTSNI